jgi:tetratricopeptide (TPR) repeat protein
MYLSGQGKNSEVIAFFEKNSHSGTPTEQAWFKSGLVSLLAFSGRLPEAAEAAHAAVAANPDTAWQWSRVASAEKGLGHGEAALAASRTFLRLSNRSASKDLLPEVIPYQRAIWSWTIDELVGDYASATRLILAGNPGLEFSADIGKQVQALESMPGITFQLGLFAPVDFAKDLIADHDVGRIPHVLADAPAFAQAFVDAAAARGDPRGQVISDATLQAFRYVGLLLAAAKDDWTQVLQTATVMQAQQPPINAAYAASSQLHFPTVIWPVVAQAEAMRGDFAAAHAQIDKTPGDCDLCLRTRGKIDAAQKNYNGAAFWFAHAAQLAPSIPFAFNDWGQMLLAKGDADAAITQFTIAHQKGPHFADPLEGWGEALMAKNKSHLAVAKFAEADKYAPNWGRLHLKWGEALVYAGKKDEAKAQFARAAQLDLTPSGKAELMKAGRNSISLH